MEFWTPARGGVATTSKSALPACRMFLSLGVRGERKMRGWVYLLGNSSMAKHYKIGMTRLHPEERARQLSAPSGVPCSFEVLAAALVPDPVAAERAMHQRYERIRPNDSREFFVFCTQDELLEACERILGLDGATDRLQAEGFTYFLNLLPKAALHA